MPKYFIKVDSLIRMDSAESGQYVNSKNGHLPCGKEDWEILRHVAESPERGCFGWVEASKEDVKNFLTEYGVNFG